MKNKLIIAVVCTLATICTFISSVTTTFAFNGSNSGLDVTRDGIVDENDFNVVKNNITSISSNGGIAMLVRIEKYLKGTAPIDYSVIAVNEENTNYIRNWCCLCTGTVTIRHACSGTSVDIFDTNTGDMVCRFVFSNGYSAELPEDANVVYRHIDEFGVVRTIWDDGEHYYISEQELEKKRVTEVKFDDPSLANWFYNCETQFKLREYPDGAIGLSFEDATSAYILVFEEGLSEMPTSGVSIIHRYWMPDEKRELVIWDGNDGYHVSTDHK